MDNVDFYDFLRGQLKTQTAQQAFDRVFLGYIGEVIKGGEFAQAVAVAYNNSKQLDT